MRRAFPAVGMQRADGERTNAGALRSAQNDNDFSRQPEIRADGDSAGVGRVQPADGGFVRR